MRSVDSDWGARSQPPRHDGPRSFKYADPSSYPPMEGLTPRSPGYGPRSAHRPEKSLCFKKILAITNSCNSCPKLTESNEEEKFLRHHSLCIFCASHKYKKGKPCKKRKYLKYDICKEQHVTILHPVNIDMGKQTSTGSVTHHAENSTDLLCSSIILPTAVVKPAAKAGHGIPVRCPISHGS